MSCGLCCIKYASATYGQYKVSLIFKSCLYYLPYLRKEWIWHYAAYREIFYFVISQILLYLA